MPYLIHSHNKPRYVRKIRHTATVDKLTVEDVKNATDILIHIKDVNKRSFYYNPYQDLYVVKQGDVVIYANNDFVLARMRLL